MSTDYKAAAKEAAEGLAKPQTALARLGGIKAQAFRDGLEAFRPQFEKALTRIDPDHFIEVATTIFLNPESRLAECEPLSVMLALRKAAQLNLRPDGQEGAVVPRGGKAYFEPMYQGLARTILRTGMYRKVEARMVRTNDHFHYQLGVNPTIEHRPAPPSEQGEFSHAYAIVWLATGETQFEVMHIEELKEIRARSKAQNNGKEGPAWRSYPGEMYRKMPLKRLSKFLEMDAEQSAVFRYDDEIDAGRDPEPGDFIPEAEWRTLDQRAQDAADAQVSDLKARVAAAQAPGEAEAFLDSKIGKGKYAERTWRSLLDAGGKDRGYVTHWVLTEKAGDFVTPEQRAWLTAYAEREDAPGTSTGPGEGTGQGSALDTLRAHAEALAVALAKQQALSIEEEEERELLSADGNLDGLRDWCEQMERRLKGGDDPPPLWPDDDNRQGG